MSDPLGSKPRESYQLIDSGDGRKLERFGDVVLARPCAQAVWGRADREAWDRADAVFRRESSSTGTWGFRRGKPASWDDGWTLKWADVTWRIHPNEFGNLGIFPEQQSCWRWIADQVASLGDVELLNLFAYTGGSTFAAAAAGARVCHIDASKTTMRQARDIAGLSGFADHPIRWITEDAERFVDREIRRGRRYQGIVLDPPTYGRGPKGEVWKIDEGIQDFVGRCGALLDKAGSFLLLTSHSPGYTPLVLSNLVTPGSGGDVEHGEMVIEDAVGRPLPSGAFARWSMASARP